MLSYFVSFQFPGRFFLSDFKRISAEEEDIRLFLAPFLADPGEDRGCSKNPLKTPACQDVNLTPNMNVNVLETRCSTLNNFITSCAP